MNHAPLYGVSNDRATVTRPVEPWTFVPNIPEFKKKDEFLVWRGNANTEHLLFIGSVGVNAALRPNAKTNPIRQLTALIGDFDVNVSEIAEEEALKQIPADFKPNWVARTFSGGRRLVYLFEQPIAFDSILTKRFFEIAARDTNYEKMFPGPDRKAFANPYQIYDVGHTWKQLSDTPISKNILHLWLTEAAKGADWSKLGEIAIPLEAVESEVHRQYPGQWSGAFTEGARGNVFWDGGTNPSAAIVQANGCICFSREKLFYSWSDILGAPFVRKFQADKIGGAVDGTWFDGRGYYQKIGGVWMTVGKDDFVKRLKVKQGLDASRGKNETASETERAEVFIQEHRRINGAIPFLFDERDVVERGGKRYLNIASVRALQPAETSCAWSEGFPWLADYFDTFFDPPEQKEFYMAWLQRFYGSALTGSLDRGQNVFLVGGIDIGKTLMGHRIIGALVGGCADASDHLVRGSEFNKTLAENALWVLDDSQVASDPVAHRKFYELVKKLASNPTINFRRMYSDAETQDWSGRLFCTLNDDSLSLQMIPDLSLSLEDKVHIFKAANVVRQFPPRYELEPLIANELPCFAKWLLEWTPPEHVIVKNRFGVRNYIHEELRTAALHSGQVGDILELASMFVKTVPPEDGDWEGKASDFYTAASAVETLRPLVTKYAPRVIGRRFAEAARIRDSGISVVDENKRHGNKYRIANPVRESKVVRLTPHVEEVAT